MDDLTEIFDAFVSEISSVSGTFRPPPGNSIGGFVPNLVGLPRDEHGIICQRDRNSGTLDGGDSVHRTGIASFCNSPEDKDLLAKFLSGRFIVRHPYQPEWNDPDKVSRDQLIGYSAGLWRAGRHDVARSLTSYVSDHGWKVNADYVLPHTQLFLRYCSGEVADASTDLLGQTMLQVMIETASSDPDVEHNQLLLESLVCGRLDLYVQVHPNWQDIIYNYWAGWRDQEPLAEALVKVVGIELERYGKRRVRLPLLLGGVLPARTFQKMLDLVAAIRRDGWVAVKIDNLPGLIKEFGLAYLRDVDDFIRQSYPVNEAEKILRDWGFIGDRAQKPKPNPINRFSRAIVPALPAIQQAALD